jgi:hypothetical protein
MQETERRRNIRTVQPRKEAMTCEGVTLIELHSLGGGNKLLFQRVSLKCQYILAGFIDINVTATPQCAVVVIRAGQSNDARVRVAAGPTEPCQAEGDSGEEATREAAAGG